MAKLSPLQRVKKDHGSKQELADKVLSLLTAPEGDDHFAHRISTLSNTKLLRVWDAHQKINAKHGSLDALIDGLVSAKFPKGNDDYRTKLASYTAPKLLDLARQAKA